ncbi:MAG TPA: hypothetical protein VG347_11715 [Verrucomicrobiae bacterium]|nr:hypothetical protein [Verrucomicrobiae bacterium]
MKVNALLLAGPSDSVAAGRLKKILAVFGVECAQMTVTEFLTAGTGEKLRVLCAAATFAELVAALAKDAEAANAWSNRAHSVFVMADGNPDALAMVAQGITGSSSIVPAAGVDWQVTDALPEFCQVMSGLPATALTENPTSVLALDAAASKAVKIIFNHSGAAFVQGEFRSVPVYLSTGGLLDVDAPLSGRVFDLKQHFLSAVPVVLYVKWALAETCWQAPETAACLVIDDPLLRPRHGFLKYQHLLDLMERVNFSTSIAFIPWNWNRSTRKIVRMFKDNPGRLSLSIHGCDHTGGEYGSRNRDRLAWKSRQAIQRMGRHQAKTGLAHDPVMVFPQGVFSGAAMSALKHEEFIGVVNSEVISADPPARPVTVADYWNVAVMNYSDFPIFTRRYPKAGVENFAFDILLGKPCIVVTHHNDFHDDYRYLVDIMEKLNKLNTRLRWTNLAEVVRRSFRQREIVPGTVEVELYASEARLENMSAKKKLFRISKREAAPDTIKEIRAGSTPAKWAAADNRIAFEIELGPGESRTIAIAFRENNVSAYPGETLKYRVKAMVRRYMCDVRDNYVLRKSYSQ